MATAKGKIPFSKDIAKEYADMFEATYKDLGGHKYRVLEAAIEVFSRLPREVQYALTGYNTGDRQLCFDLIDGLELPLKQSAPARKAKSAKSAG